MKMLANQSACNYEMHELVKSKLSIDYRIINRTSGRNVLPFTCLRNFYWIARRNLFPETSRKGTSLIGKMNEPCLLVRLIFLIKPVIRFHLNPRNTDRLKVTNIPKLYKYPIFFSKIMLSRMKLLSLLRRYREVDLTSARYKYKSHCRQ